MERSHEMKHTPSVDGRFLDGYRAARQAAAVRRNSDRAWIAVSGRDRAEYLQGLLTNDIVKLKSGEGCYALYLTPQGRLIADLWVYELGDVMLLGLPQPVKETVLARLDQFIFSEDVQLGDVSTTLATLSVIGPRSAECIAAALGIAATLGANEGLFAARRDLFEGEPAMVLGADSFGVPGFEVVVDRRHVDAALARLVQSGAVEIDDGVAETLRIEGGVPAFGQDMDEETIPLEAGIEPRAISFSKGCYVGQEVIIRILHRGHGRVAKKLVGLALPKDAAALPSASILAGERSIGKVTSAAWSPMLERPIALGYVHRDFVAAGTAVQVAGAEATVTSLPFHQ